ncbi:MAG: gliding motility-associated ABC transporter substrate-binding protein GldG, partial [Bacteroidota bacterium]|nr:gliding motility-associated ABC transporter substrate-binding protein GldG [Bacteroidota bacterium]
FTRIDLTAENRYSLSDATKKLLGDVDDIIFFKVYLEGDFPAGFKNLRRETKEMLDEFRAYNGNIEYQFIDPSKVGNSKEVNDFYQQLAVKGLKPTELFVSESAGSSNRVIFPGAVVSYGNMEVPVDFLVSQKGMPPEKALNSSIQNLEYTIANAIQKLTSKHRPNIGFIIGHGELSEAETMDIAHSMSEFYNLERVKIDGDITSLTKRDSVGTDIEVFLRYDAIVIAKPTTSFSERDKFIIDQYVMRGGKIMWFVDPVIASMDSLQNATSTMAVSNDINIQDMLFKYGVRLNPNLIMDLNCGAIPIVTGSVGGQPQQKFFPWYYFPVVMPYQKHPIINNVDAIKTDFVSSLDIVGAKGIDKTVLLKTSQYSNVKNVPALISLEEMRVKPDVKNYSDPAQIIGVLLEGRFESLFTNRMPPEIRDNPLMGFKNKGELSKIIVFSDGDIIRNQLHYSRGTPLSLGYDQFTGQSFGNKELIMNAMSYLVNENGIINTRSKEFEMRLLDPTKIQEKDRLKWQLVNIIIPILLVILFGIIRNYLRKRKYTRKLLSGNDK